MDSVIDTNVLVDYIIKGSNLHEKAVAALGMVDNGYVPSVVIEELAYVLLRIGLDKKEINDEISRTLDSYDLVSVDNEDILQAQQIIMKEGQTTFKKFNDKLILSAAKKKDMPLLTFDKELIKECHANGVKVLDI